MIASERAKFERGGEREREKRRREREKVRKRKSFSYRMFKVYCYRSNRLFVFLCVRFNCLVFVFIWIWIIWCVWDADGNCGVCVCVFLGCMNEIYCGKNIESIQFQFDSLMMCDNENIQAKSKCVHCMPNMWKICSGIFFSISIPNGK